jgi:hypothetical protein
MTELVFYKKLAALNKDKHRLHSFKRFENLNFAARTQLVLLTGSEFTEAVKEYPIVFVKNPDGSMMPVALLGFRENENLYVDPEGKWNARYIPAYVRRYPFIFFETTADGFFVGVDEDCKELNVNGEGERLFNDDGEPSAFVGNMIKFMNDYQADYQRTLAFTNHLQKLDLLKEGNAKFTRSTGEEFLVNGLWTVDEAKLNALSDENLLKLVKSGELGRIHAHLISLSNFGQLSELDAKRSVGNK